jgi:hypothetical protein
MNRIVILIFGILVTCLAACTMAATRPVEIINGTPVSVEKVLGAFYAINGTHYQLASIDVPQEGRVVRDLSQLFSTGRLDYGVYNYVFLDVDSETVHALLPNNQSFILSIRGYPFSETGDLPKVPVAWWLYTIVKEDTNHDGQLSSLDRKTLAVSDVAGNGYTEIIADVDRILGDVFKEGNALLIVYHANGKNFLAHVDLLTRKVTTTTELPFFGEDVK